MIIYRTDKPYLFGFSGAMRQFIFDIPQELFGERFLGRLDGTLKVGAEIRCNACSPAPSTSAPRASRPPRQPRGRALRRRRAGTALQHHRRADRRTPRQRPQRLLPAHRQAPHRRTTRRPGPQLRALGPGHRYLRAPPHPPIRPESGSPSRYIAERRLELAHRLLSSPQASGLISARWPTGTAIRAKRISRGASGRGMGGRRVR